MGVPNAVRHLWRHPAREKNQTKKQKKKLVMSKKWGAEVLGWRIGKSFWRNDFSLGSFVGQCKQ